MRQIILRYEARGQSGAPGMLTYAPGSASPDVAAAGAAEVVNLVATPAIALDADYSILATNAAARALLGQGNDDPVGTHVLKLLSEHSLAEAVTELLRVTPVGQVEGRQVEAVLGYERKKLVVSIGRARAGSSPAYVVTLAGR